MELRLGIATAYPHNSPIEWAQKHKNAGHEAVVLPVDYKCEIGVIDQYISAASDAGLIIAEVGAWSNPMSPDESKRREAIEMCKRQLELAEYVSASCCVNISGAVGEIWDGGYAENFTAETYERIVLTTQKIIDAVKPKRTKYTLEPMPNMLPDSPDSYLDLIRDIDRDGFGVHLDAVNMLTSPRRYFFNCEFVTECFDKLGNYIASCHIKDACLENTLTVRIRECECGEGGFDIAHFCTECDRINPDIPMIIEHLSSHDAYNKAFQYVISVVKR